MNILIALLFSINFALAAAPIKVIEEKKAKDSVSAHLVHKNEPKPHKTKKETQSPELLEVIELDKNSSADIKKFLNQNSLGIWDFTSRFDVKTGSTLSGILLNSIVSSNLESPLLIEVTEGLYSIEKGSRISCFGVSKNKRVFANCNKLILESDEYDIDAILLNMDGTAGLLGRAYSGKEQYAVGAMSAAALKGALDVSIDRVNNAYGGETVLTNSKNKIKSGAIGALDEIVEMSTDEFKHQESKISIDAGKSVLIYFQRRFKQ